MNLKKIILISILSLFGVSQSFAETRITYKSAKSTSSYYQMAVQIADTIKKSTKGNMILTIEESQGSVQNVKEVAGRKGNYVFTTPPVLVKLAIAEKAMFKGKGNNEIKIMHCLRNPLRLFQGQATEERTRQLHGSKSSIAFAYFRIAFS